MKRPFNTILIIMIIAIIGCGIAKILTSKRDCVVLMSGEIVVTQSFLDSLAYIANLPADTIRDTIVVEGDPIEFDIPIAELISIDTLRDITQSDSCNCPVNSYRQDMLNEGIDAWVEIKVKGYLENYKWGYTPITTEITTIIEKPLPVPTPYPVPIKQGELFGYIGVGGNKGNTTISADLIYQHKKGYSYGAQVMQMGGNRYYLAKFGIKLYSHD